MNSNLASGQSDALLIRSHPLGIGEGFELRPDETIPEPNGLNPLGIGEGFEPQDKITKREEPICLNPLGIGEGFEPTEYFPCGKHLVLIP